MDRFAYNGEEKIFNTSIKIAVYNHGGCHDGETAASVCYKALNNNATYHPIGHHYKWSEEEKKVDWIIFVDICPKEEILNDLVSKVKYVTVIDHHKTAKTVKGVDFFYNINVSGCILAHWYFFPHLPVPEMCKYVSDRDIWTWELPYSKEINNGMWLGLDITKENAHYIMTHWDKVKYKNLGIEFIKAKSIMCDTLIKNAYIGTFCDLTVYVIDCPYMFRSVVGNTIILKSKNIDVCLLYSFKADKSVFSISLRSLKTDVSILAQKYGGGGHKHASGMQLYSLSEAINNIRYPSQE